MGGSKKGASQEVYDFLMSIDYGLCYGPVDTLNQVWVKDKPIWCGRATERQDIEVIRPGLFGGDTGEGGVVGTVEFYPGNEGQKSSAQLAGRVGRTIETMPGYSGLAHLFFRGNLGNREPSRKAGGSIGLIAYAVFGKQDKRGFRWGTNNPYLGAMKASVTRLPKKLDANWIIYPPVIDENGNMVDDPDGAVQTPEGLIDPPNLMDTFGIFIYDFFPAHEQAQVPYKVLDFANVTDEELLVGAANGWVPSININYSVGTQDAGGAVLNSRHRVRVLEMDADENILEDNRWSNLDGTEKFDLAETVILNEGTRMIKFMATVFSDEGTIASLTPGSTYDISLAFTEKQDQTATTPINIFTETAGGSHAVNGSLIDLLAEGFTEEAIDSGLLTYRATSFFAANYVGLGGSDGTSVDCVMFATGIRANPDGTPNFSQQVSLSKADDTPYTSASFGAVTGIGWVSYRTGALKVRPGTRFVSAYVIGNRGLPVFSVWTAKTASASVYGPGKVVGDGHCSVDKTLGILPDCNPSQLIYECLVNPDWGKGEDPLMINTETFIAAAETLRSEYFGLSMIWVKQDTIEKFIQETLDHIQAFLFQDPATGLWNLKLLRDDYDIADSMHIDESVAVLKGQKRKAWGETINEIVVSYTDPITEKAVTVSSHNLGNIAMNGGIISETRDYHGIRNPILAKVVADRDVESAGYPVFTCQAEVDRTFWKVRPGDVVTLSWGDEGLSFAAMRVLGVDYGSPKDRTITLDLSEDIYALEQTSYSGGQQSLLDSDLVPATPMDAEMVVTAPLPSMVRMGLPLPDVDANEPVVNGLIMADSEERPISIQIHTEVVKGNGDVVVESVGSVSPTMSILTTVDLFPEVKSRLPEEIIDILRVGLQEPGDIFMLGLSEAESELVMLDQFFPEDEEWSVIRGVWDTVPGTWSLGSRLWLFPSGVSKVDPGERAAGETRSYRLLPATRFNRLPFSEAADLVKTFSERPFAPFRPANCELDGAGNFAGVDYSYATTGAALPSTITASWSNRNRGTEDSVATTWGEAEMTPEVGQTTVLRILDRDGVFSHEITGLSGSSYAIPIASFSPVELGFVEFVSVRDDFRSLWADRLPFDIRQGGYGRRYGQSYGE